ncbi:hypothetical protein BVRB_4g090950 [Beta vulgaris subsp. vulgaris]|uniref:Uncharacterized protein n=1 Tax=Beta vulgaris subsp. vulgaris TaxID=3555 RepID=A0A0J8CFV4_BETVV|nr:hypothetical protein BVRB_4g090950 [Beta vulgaris subsp. vulgaris]
MVSLLRMPTAKICILGIKKLQRKICILAGAKKLQS